MFILQAVIPDAEKVVWVQEMKQPIYIHNSHKYKLQDTNNLPTGKAGAPRCDGKSGMGSFGGTILDSANSCSANIHVGSRDTYSVQLLTFG